MSWLKRVSGAPDAIELADVKAALAIIGNADDALLSRLIDSAQASLDGAEGRLARCLSVQTWQLGFGGFPLGGPISIPLPPLISINGISYVDGNGDAKEFEDFTVDGIGSTDKAVLNATGRWPYGTNVIIEFTCGFGELPEDLRDALIAIVGSRYAWRESQVMAQGSLSAMPEVEDAIDRWTVKGFG
ncbi:hypothetical protein [Mesorhizobium sp. IMUNJ 23232]|uniref:head-tail connector protein n=1 Tax=Mesorhizobium sp. IMUNJ 23232 TaxID=3376064 RepID=UPI003795C9B2